MANKPLLFTIAAIIGLISLAISSTIPASAPGEAMGVIDEAATEAPADAAVEPDVPAKASIEVQLVGSWVQAKRGGEDGQTDCKAASFNESFIRREGNKLSFLRYGEAGDFGQLYMDENIDTQVTTEGTWVLNDNVISLTIEAAGLGKLTDDVNKLPGKPDLQGSTSKMRIHFDGPNILFQTTIETGVTNRFARCK